MMKQEFEQLAGYEVSAEDYYNIINPMYMATDLDKQDFVLCVNKKRFALNTKKQLIKEAKKISKEYQNLTSSERFEAEYRIRYIVHELQERFYRGYKVTTNWTDPTLGPVRIEIFDKRTFETVDVFNLA